MTSSSGKKILNKLITNKPGVNNFFEDKTFTKNIIDTSEFMAWNPGSHQPEFKTSAGNKERKTSNSNDSDSPDNAKVVEQDLIDSSESERLIAEYEKGLINSLGSLSNDPVKLALGEKDYDELTEEMKQEFPLVQFILDQKLSQGSAYGRMNDKTINDLSEERLADIVNKVLSNG